MCPLAATSTETPVVRFEETAGGTHVPLGFHSIAGLLDAIAGHAPARLSTQLTIIWETSFKEEMRRVLRLAVACRDPLSDLGTICIDAIQTSLDLEKIVKAQHWTSLSSCTGQSDPRAGALVNLCDHQIAQLTRRRAQRPYKAIRERLDAAATVERQLRNKEMTAFAGLRVARCPKIWTLYDKWINTE